MEVASIITNGYVLNYSYKWRLWSASFGTAYTKESADCQALHDFQMYVHALCMALQLHGD